MMAADDGSRPPVAEAGALNVVLAGASGYGDDDDASGGDNAAAAAHIGRVSRGDNSVLPSNSEAPSAIALSSNSGEGGASAQPAASPEIAARGGTVRSHASTFPALFGMVKGMPQTAHDADALFRLAFPADGGSGAGGAVDRWHNHVAPARLARLREAARASVAGDMDSPGRAES